eukprot:CAMPEP_0119514694 /NCGR_PEP_ID=MMETSP1344-20130328/32437_1 /TAXON_ID=236787 /ORGANISM="Florenciella parvula, Strain CCMP2471" /LENGTH=104 /DNA_ID=CAMNT_0007552033 /DNA_START=99 /DNA_END=409 /DNA_ORIENTATION=-
MSTISGSAAGHRNVHAMNVAKGTVDTDLKRTDTGINTVEGNVAGARAGRLTQQREKEQAEYNAKKAQIKKDQASRMKNVDDRFNTASLEFKTATAGLHTKEDFA